MRKQLVTSKEQNKELLERITGLLLKWKEVMLGKADSKTREGKRAFEEKLEAPDDDGDAVSVTTLEGKRTRGEIQNTQPDSPSQARVTSTPETFNDEFLPLREKYNTGDAIRDKCLEMLLVALMVDNPSEEPDELVLSTCRSIETFLFEEFNSQTSAAYKAKFRSRYLNLKDKNNLHLRQALLSGTIAPKRFCSMSSSELASEERRQEDRRLMEQNLSQSRAAQDNEAETDQFRCGRCGQRRTKYYQLQTRSADEPMTTFVTCINCGNRWKFC